MRRERVGLVSAVGAYRQLTGEARRSSQALIDKGDRSKQKRKASAGLEDRLDDRKDWIQAWRAKQKQTAVVTAATPDTAATPADTAYVPIR
jgi:hypothetical protein